MKVFEADAGRVAAVARRIAVALALREIDRGLRRTSGSDAARAVLVDDLCSLSYAVDSAGVSDASLAVGAADPDRATSMAARTAYAARLLLRDAWVTETAASNGASQSAPAHRYACVRAALTGLRELEVSRARAPRAMLELMAKGGPPDPHLIVLRLVAAAHAPDAADLVEALAAPPLDLEASELSAALDAQTGPPRSAFAAAIPNLAGHGARERAIAALEVLDAVLESSASSNALARGARAARKAIAALPSGDAFGASDGDDEFLSVADRIFDVAAPDLRAGERARLVMESLACAEDETIVLFPYAGPIRLQATIEFDDAPSPVDLTRFAAALDLDASALRSSCKPGLRVVVASPLAGALVEFALGRETAPAGRAMPPADPEAVFASPGMVFSASRLNSYVKCPRRFFYDYLCEAIEDPGSLHATYGRVVHDALEMLHREIRVPAKHEPSYILDRLLRDLDAAFGAARSAFASQLAYESSRWRARRMAEQYVRWLCAEAKRAPMEIAAVEVFERRRFGEHDFVGYIDRVDRPEGGGPATIYDYKTGRIDDDAEAYMEKVRSGEEAQLALYYAMRHAAGDMVRRIALVSIRDPRDEVWILALDIVDDAESAASIDREAGVVRAVCSTADLDASLQALIRRCDLLAKDGVARFGPGEDPPCGFCAYARACRDRPLHGERTFAR